MRAIPIDSFFEDLEGKRAVAADEAVNAASFDWGRIVAEGRAARSAADGGRWRIGHLTLLIERRYASGAVQRFAEAIGESYGTVRRYRWVAKAYDPDIRLRLPSLSFSHFQAVAGLPDRLSWLQRASRGGWSVDRLTRESRGTASQAKRTSRAVSRMEQMRTSIGELRRSIAECSVLPDPALGVAGKGWLLAELDDLAVELDRLRDRARRATRMAESRRSLRVARDPGTPPTKPRTPTALKARAVGR